MAPLPTSPERPNAPLADYFFICGIESSQICEERPVLAAQPLGATIEEDKALETDLDSRPSSPPDSRSRQSWEPRKSIGSIIGFEHRNTASNRSSATIKGIQIGGTGFSEADFDNALRKFASERDTFLEEIQFTAGTIAIPSKPKPRPKTQRIMGDESGGTKSGAGSLRRKLSTMNSMKRQPSSARQASIRTSRRMSGYNSVIPAPRPFVPTPDMHPLKRRYEPVLLDRYPPKGTPDESNRRVSFPDYVPMFAFPNDISVVSSDERPRSTWHGFTMTGSDNAKLHGICVIIWLPLNHTASAELERQCDEWRKHNMSGEHREFANSLGERLALERAKLSQLLAKLPNVPSGTEERDALEDDIGMVEEKIGLMSDLLRPVRHAAASKIDGLTDGETGLWIPRAYGLLGKDGTMTSFWKEWLRAVVVPMTNGAIQRVPASSPKLGVWQPLERYVVNLCAEALSPISSITQVEVAVRELRLYARKEAINELPGSRNTDLYALFRSLSIENVVLLFEYALSEARIILLSSYTSMLHLASAAISSLLYPQKWAGVFIPVLPARLIQALEAPCPYIVGIERRYEDVTLPDDDYVLVDLDQNTIESQARPAPLPKQQRRKLISLLQVAAGHHLRYGVPVGPPDYAKETYPNDMFASENAAIFNSNVQKATIGSYAGLNSASFSEMSNLGGSRNCVFNAFLHSRRANSRESDRPVTSGHGKPGSPPSPANSSPVSANFPPVPTTPVSRNDSGFALQASLREKRSGYFDTSSRRNSSFGFDRAPTLRRPSQPLAGHAPSLSTSTIGTDFGSGSTYAPSVYAQSTLAASTIMPGMFAQSVRNTETTIWVEGHCLQLRPYDERITCSVCDEKAEDGLYRCTGCAVSVHGRCSQQVNIVCQSAFRPDQVRAAFVRCFASLFYTYRKHLRPADGDRKKAGMLYAFDTASFIKSIPQENAEYIEMLLQTQGFNEFIHERETKKSDDPSIMLFDQIIIAKKNRGKSSLFSKSTTSFLSDTSDHLWRSAVATSSSNRFPSDYKQTLGRIPAKLDPSLMKEPRVIQGVRISQQVKAKRKPIPSMLGPPSSHLKNETTL